MISTVILVVHVLVAASLIGFVLLQQGKGADAGAGFGAGASGTVFGSRGTANFLSRSTAVLATVFFITSLSLAFLSGEKVVATSVVDKIEAATPASDVPQVTGQPASDVPALTDPAAKDAPPASGAQ